MVGPGQFGTVAFLVLVKVEGRVQALAVEGCLEMVHWDPSGDVESQTVTQGPCPCEWVRDPRGDNGVAVG